MKAICVLLGLASCALAADYRTPAGFQRTRRTEDGLGTILPGGRLLSPYGTEYTTGPGPFGLTVSPSGNRIVTANGGPDRFSLTVLEKTGSDWKARQIPIAPKKAEKAEAGDEWKSTFMGLAFDGDDTLYASEGESGEVRAVDLASGKHLGQFDLNTGGFHDSYSAELALDRQRGILYVVDQANFRVAVFDTRERKPLASIAVGRLPFAIALAPIRSFRARMPSTRGKPVSSSLLLDSPRKNRWMARW